MAEQRPAFRFRLPWLLPSEPAAPPPRPPVPTPQTATPATTTTTQSPIPPTPAAPPPRPPVPTTQTVTPATTTTQTPIPPTQAAPLPRPPVPTTQTVTPATTTTQTPILPTQVAPRPRPSVPTPQSVTPATIATTTQTPIPPTPTQTPPTTTPRTPALRPPTTTQTPVPPTPTTQRPPITTSQTSTPITSAQRPPTTTQTPIPQNPTQRPSTTTQTLIPPTAAPRPPTTAQILNSATPTQRPLSRPLGLAPSEPPPPPPPPKAQSPTSTKPEPALVKIPNNQPTDVTQSPTDPPSPATPPQRPPFRPAGSTQSQTSSPKAQASPRNESQPSSPFRAGTQSRANSQPPSPSRIATQSRVSSQPASPSRVGTQSRVPSQSPSPSRATTQSRATSQPSSPSRQTIQSKTASQPSSPSRKQSQTTSLPRSPSKLFSQRTGKISSLPSSPAKTSTKIEPPEDSVSQPPSSRTIQQIDKEIPPPNFNDLEPLVSEKGEQKVTPPLLESQKPRPNTETAIDNTSNNHNSHKLRATETTTQPNVLVPTDLPHMRKKSDSIPSSSNLALLRDKPEAKKEPQQKLDDSMVEYGEIEEKTVAELIAKLSKPKAQTKEQPSFVVQTNQKQPEKQLHTKEQYTTSMSNGRETKTTTPHTVDKSPVSESRQRPVTSNNGAQVPLHKEIRDDISRFAQNMATTHPKKPMDEKSMTVITIAGENRGALMHLGSEMAKREGAVHIRRGYKINPDESGNTTDGEGSSRGRRQKDSTTREDEASKAYVNNNTQGVNNSIVFNSSITQGSPGVHLTITRHLPKPNKSNHKTEPLEARKAEFNITPAQKLTYEPIVRRRCLRGLFLEPSDSDDDNPEKPRRHGCRYGCGEKSKDGEIDVV